MKQLKIKKEFWDMIVSGEKSYEFRKLSKGLETGTYQFVSIETVSEANDEFEACEHGCLNCWGNEICWKGNLPNEIYGTAKLTPYKINPHFNNIALEYDEYCYFKGKWFHSEIGSDEPVATEEGYKFIKENYIDENIDFVEYEIDEVKEWKINY